jgi:hypothetical protein
VLGTRVVVRSRPNLGYFKFTYFMIFHSDFFICERCESIPSDSDAKNEDHHKWWHSLLVLRKILIEPVLKTASSSKKVEPTDTQAETQATAAMEGKVDSTRVGLERQLSSTTMNLEERVMKLDEKITELTKMNLEERVIKLDEKITELTKMLGGLIGRLNT